MPIEIHWANHAHNILIEKFYDVWTWEQVAHACEVDISPLLSDPVAPTVLIQDMVGSHWTPTTNLLTEVQQMMKTPYPDNVVMVIVVSGNPSIDTLVIAAYKRYGGEPTIYQSCPTTNQAIQIADEYLNQY